MTKPYVSHALWEEDSGVRDIYGKNESSDRHCSEESAHFVCKILERDGLGGVQIHFPIKTWVTYEED